MKYEELILSDLRECDYLRYDDRRVVARRMPVLQKLQEKGKITMKLVEVDEQESYLEIRLMEGEA